MPFFGQSDISVLPHAISCPISSDYKSLSDIMTSELRYRDKLLENRTFSPSWHLQLSYDYIQRKVVLIYFLSSTP